MTQSDKEKAFTRIIFRWFQIHERKMPWRETSDPYRILVSEIMLQQTQVDRVRGKYEEFLRRFPDVFALASAERAEVLALWSGLGYNRRARYLHECAKIIVSEEGGVFPGTYEALIHLPGIGRSTAGALLAFAFAQDTPMIDTNIRRILTRVFFRRRKTPPSDAELYAFACRIIPKGRGRVWNYALLDIGATQCTARNHADSCPLRSLHGPVADVVKKKPALPFAKSSRFYRGKIVKLLVDRKRLTLRELARLLPLPLSALPPLVEGLVSDRLIHLKHDTVTLSLD